MNLIELSREVKRESGLSGDGATTVSLAKGNDERILAWVREAWRDIDLMHETWTWRQAQAEGQTSGAMLMEPGAAAPGFALTSFARWRQHTRLYQPTAFRVSDGLQAERPLGFLPYDRFRRLFMVGVHQPGGLQYWSESPAGDFMVGPTPDSTHVVRADYIRDHVPLVADTDTPALPARFHPLIVWRALREYGGFDAATEAYMRADRNLSGGLPSLRQACLPEIRFSTRGLA